MNEKYIDTDDPLIIKEGKDQFYDYILVQNIGMTFLELFMVFIREKPPTPPSASE